MRLLESCGRNIRLTEELVGQIPSYAILSHTWGADGEEVTFRDMIDGTADRKRGYDKIKFCAAKTLADGLYYFWVDTCCIDKTNSTELIEAINSMFKWYQKADRCYMYLFDVSASNLRYCWDSYEFQFRASRWFTRGWTLQELLAPSSVEFFTREGLRLGDKKDLDQWIHEITRIAVTALHSRPLTHFTTEERFRWAADRNTTKEEDWAYCLLGIFGVYMPLIYGEGKENAVRRLRKEIAEATDCKSIPGTAQGTPCIMLSYLTLCALQDPSNIDLEISRNPSGGQGAAISHNHVAEDYIFHLEGRYVQAKGWFCGWCHFGPLDCASDTICVECKRPRDHYCILKR